MVILSILFAGKVSRRIRSYTRA